jgi:hypothetical protein
MKNLRLLTLIAAACLFSLNTFAQSFSDYGTYTGNTSDGSTIVIELNSNDVATLTINEITQGVVEYAYQPAFSSTLKLKSLPTAATLSEALATPQFRGCLFEQINATQWKLQLGEVGQSTPANFDSNAIILDFKPN